MKEFLSEFAPFECLRKGGHASSRIGGRHASSTTERSKTALRGEFRKSKAFNPRHSRNGLDLSDHVRSAFAAIRPASCKAVAQSPTGRSGQTLIARSSQELHENQDAVDAGE
jgi:hypothetical protein